MAGYVHTVDAVLRYLHVTVSCCRQTFFGKNRLNEPSACSMSREVSASLARGRGYPSTKGEWKRTNQARASLQNDQRDITPVVAYRHGRQETPGSADRKAIPTLFASATDRRAEEPFGRHRNAGAASHQAGYRRVPGAAEKNKTRPFYCRELGNRYQHRRGNHLRGCRRTSALRRASGSR